MFIEATYQSMYIDVTRLYYYFFVSDLFFSPNQIRCKMNTSNVPVYSNNAVYGYVLITKIPVYILFNPCEKVTQCACARLVAH